MANRVGSRLNERQFVLIYLLVATLVLSSVGGWVLVRVYGGYPALNARTLAEKIKQEQNYFSQQRQYLTVLDSVHHTISAYHSDVTAVFIEADIEEQIRQVRRVYRVNDSLMIFKGFDQAANFYQMMYRDKKVLASKKDNIKLFVKQLEDCRLGYHPAPASAVLAPASRP